MKVMLEDIIEAIELSDKLSDILLDKETGEIVVLNDMYMTREEIEEIEDTLDEHGFYRLPTKWDLNDYEIMESFVNSLPDTEQELLAYAIKGKGAFRRFNNEIHRLGIAKQWYAWHDDVYRQKVIDWCRENEIEYE